MDFGQYTEKEFVTKLRALQDAGDPKGRLCERCGQKTKAGKIFGMIICNPCWKKQTNPELDTSIVIPHLRGDKVLSAQLTQVAVSTFRG